MTGREEWKNVIAYDTGFNFGAVYAASIGIALAGAATYIGWSPLVVAGGLAVLIVFELGRVLLRVLAALEDDSKYSERECRDCGGRQVLVRDATTHDSFWLCTDVECDRRDWTQVTYIGTEQ